MALVFSVSGIGSHLAACFLLVEPDNVVLSAGCLVNSSLAESDDNINVLRLRSKLYEWNKDSNRFVNLNDPGNQLTKEEMVQVADALRGGVEETCVEVVKRKQNMKRMSTVEMLYNQEKAKPIPQSSKQDKSIWCGFC
eukprot:GHVT01045836.1.p1 GENE.GHVT01045836.1~~GHVT01045836.1.p1  ORF type:complete len:138 (-),score=15.20 GHVT01045836.1:283-696(-)